MVERFQTLASTPVSIDMRKQLFDMWVFVFSTINKPTRKVLFSEVILRFDLVENTNFSSHKESLPYTKTEVNKAVDTDQADVKSIKLSYPVNLPYADTELEPIIENDNLCVINLPFHQETLT